MTNQETNPKWAFVLRIAPSGNDRLPEAVKSNQIVIGWSEAEGLLKPSLTKSQFRDIIHKMYYPDDPNLRKAGAAAGHMGRFVREFRV